MKIRVVTITGADNQTSIEDMFAISEEFPFVEWGILFSPKRYGSERYPTYNWLNNLHTKWRSNKNINLAAHLCGNFSSEMLVGKMDLVWNSDLANYIRMFDRIQLNFNVTKHPVNTDEFIKLLRKHGLKYILQMNKSNAQFCLDIATYNQGNVSFLYDGSGGRGIPPESWNSPIPGYHTGYAGGLSPDNIEEELIKINRKCTNTHTIWIDAETHLRTNEVLDLHKVRSFLKTASTYVKK